MSYVRNRMLPSRIPVSVHPFREFTLTPNLVTLNSVTAIIQYRMTPFDPMNIIPFDSEGNLLVVVPHRGYACIVPKIQPDRYLDPPV